MDLNEAFEYRELKREIYYYRNLVSEYLSQIQTLEKELASYRSQSIEFSTFRENIQLAHNALDQLNAPSGHLVDRIQALRKTPLK